MTAAPDAVDRTGLARRGGLNLIGAVGSAGLNFGLTVVVTRSLAVEEAGTFFAVTSLLLLLVGLARLGSGTGLVYWISRLRALGRDDLIGACLRHALTPVVAVSLLLAGALLLGADQVAGLLVDEGSQRDAAAGAVRAVALLLPFAAVLEGVLGASRGYHDMRPTVGVEKLLRPALQLALVAAVASVGLAAVSLAWAAPYLPALLLGSGWLVRLRRRARRSPPVEGSLEELARPVGERRGRRQGSRPAREFSLRRAYWSFTAPRALSGLVQVVLQRLDVLLVTVLLDAGSAALYVAASRLLVLGAFGIQAVTMAVQPQLAAHFARRELDAARTLYRLSTTWLVLLTWPLYLVGVVHPATVLGIFGPEYAAGRDVLVVLACATLLSTACGVVDAVLTMAGRTSLILVNVAVSLVVNVSLNLLLIPRFGIIGAAWAWAGAIAVNNLLPLAQVRWSLGLHPFGRQGAEAIALTVGSWLLPGVALVQLLGPGAPALAATVGVGAVVQCALMWWRRDALALAELVPVRRRQ